MNNISIDWYMTRIRQEVEKKTQEGFTGNIDFKVNFVGGGIVNMNFGMSKSFKCLHAVES